jgi:hypothetical protein
MTYRSKCDGPFVQHTPHRKSRPLNLVNTRFLVLELSLLGGIESGGNFRVVCVWSRCLSLQSSGNVISCLWDTRWVFSVISIFRFVAFVDEFPLVFLLVHSNSRLYLGKRT